MAPPSPQPPSRNIITDTNAPNDESRYNPTNNVDLLNMSQSPKIVKPPEPKMVPKEPSFDLLGGFESSETISGKPMPDILGEMH